MANEQRTEHIIFANCAGAARGEKCDPRRLGGVIRERLGPRSLLAVGQSESLRSIQGEDVIQRADTAAGLTMSSSQTPLESSLAELDDTAEVRQGMGVDWHAYFFAHLDSRAHCSRGAINNKWHGTANIRTAERISDRYKLGHRLMQGTGLLLRQAPVGDPAGVLLRPAGLHPSKNPTNNPLKYLGNRNSEPRTMMVARVEILGAEVDLAFCQLETHKKDNRWWSPDAKPRPKDVARGPGKPGPGHRLDQVKQILKYFSQRETKRPVILMGDFNARPGTRELQSLCQGRRGFRQVMPEGWPRFIPTWGQGYALQGRMNRPHFRAPEKEQNRPYTHLEQYILIDSAFVMGFNDTWAFRLEVLEFDDESAVGRLSDHRPILLSICRK